MSGVITGKVAAVIDDTTLVLNIGLREGVREGMVFSIVAEYDQIQDPDTGESLGKWEMVKARVVVTHVQERMCTVRSPLGHEAPNTGTLSAMMVQHSFGYFGQQAEERQRLEVRLHDLKGHPKGTPIMIGDLARSLLLEEEGRGTASGEDSSRQERGDEVPQR